MTPRLTAPQMAVLRALDKLPEGLVVSPEEGGFGETEAIELAHLSNDPRLVRVTWWGHYDLSPAGRSLIAKLKAEGQW